MSKNGSLTPSSSATRRRDNRNAGVTLELDAVTSVRMGKIRQKNTAAEQAVRRLLWSLGLRYTLVNRDLPGSPDIANRSHRWVVFVHGCFWHSHRGCPRATIPKRNRPFWVAKFAANRARDRKVVVALRRVGYHVVVVWECELGEPLELERQLRRELRAVLKKPR